MNALFVTNYVLTRQGDAYVATFESGRRMTAVRLTQSRARKLHAELGEMLARDAKEQANDDLPTARMAQRAAGGRRDDAQPGGVQ